MSGIRPRVFLARFGKLVSSDNMRLIGAAFQIKVESIGRATHSQLV